MRKYYQAALAIIASLSLIALLFYRHEYNRLRYVLEVFNYFGSEKSNTNCTGVLSSVVKLYELRDYDNDDQTMLDFDDPVPSWHRLTDSIYMYSAYRTNNGEIRAVALVKGKGSNLMLSCDVFYENDVEPIAGEFSYKSIESSSSDSKRAGLIYRGYHFICNHTSRMKERKTIALVKFSTKYQSANGASIMLPVKDLLAEHPANETTNSTNISAICVVPPFTLTPLIDKDMMNFISFHSSIGIGNFIIYDFGIPPRFNNIMKLIANQGKKRYNMDELSNNFTYTTIPWNFPASGQVAPDVIRKIIQADCLYRTHKKIQIIATLTWNEYIVLKYHRTIAKLFRDIEKTGFMGDRYRVSTLNLCVDETEKSHDYPMVFGNEKFFDKSHPTYIHYRQSTTMKKWVSIDDAEIETRETTPDVIVVNRYEQDHCDRINDLELIPLNDRYVGKFSKTITNSTISKLFLLRAH